MVKERLWRRWCTFLAAENSVGNAQEHVRMRTSFTKNPVGAQAQVTSQEVKLKYTYKRPHQS